MFRRHKTVDFRTIDVRVSDNIKGRRTKRGYGFEITTIYIEHIQQQLKQLISLKAELYVGDSIELDTYFGWLDADEWLTFPIKGRFRVKGIFPEPENNEIRLLVSPIRLKFGLSYPMGGLPRQ